MQKKILLSTILGLCFVFGCASVQPEFDWDVNESRTLVSGIFFCGCDSAVVSMILTDEDTGEDFETEFTVYPGKQFTQNIYIKSEWLSVHLELKEVK